MDTQAVTRLSQPSGLNPASAPTVRAAAEALRLGRITIQDFYRHDYNQRVYLSIQIPIRDESDGNRPLGVLVLRIDPTKQFYPFMERWPTPSKTAETLLVRREGNEVVFLNELRFQTNTALNLRAPLDRVALPAAQAALGRKGIMDGIDYRGETVIAALRTIPDSPWALVARMDRAEVYGPLRERLWQMAVRPVPPGPSAVGGGAARSEPGPRRNSQHDSREGLLEGSQSDISRLQPGVRARCGVFQPERHHRERRLSDGLA
jgi:hypothetical protein